jgi:hypothetical protein
MSSSINKSTMIRKSSKKKLGLHYRKMSKDVEEHRLNTSKKRYKSHNYNNLAKGRNYLAQFKSGSSHDTYVDIARADAVQRVKARSFSRSYTLVDKKLPKPYKGKLGKTEDRKSTTNLSSQPRKISR